MKNDELIWFLFDFDDVLTSGYNRGNSDIPIFIKVLTLRKNKKKTFQEACLKFGLRPIDIAIKYSKATKPNLKLIEKLKVLDSLKRQGEQIAIGIASNNSDYLIYQWLKYYKLGHYFDKILTPENLGWIWKPERQYFHNLMVMLGVNPEQIVFFDDDVQAVDIALKLDINSYLYRRHGDFEEIEQYLRKKKK